MTQYNSTEHHEYDEEVKGEEPQMAQQCIQNEYFDKLLTACKPCHLRCSHTPPLPCQRYCDAMKETNTILWTCLGLSLIVSLTVFVLMFLLKKMNSEPSKNERKNTGSALQNEVNTDQEEGCASRTAMEEGATILVTTKTNDYCNSLLASITEMEKPIFTR
ncbi:tumor necrosis factor receptor superfamily member 17 isoform X2 [Zalophus californianus]|uniref:Tumor necrosis factor receptor superfamily member 17 isoform X2 n=1 Tax=Zalophus californianus TaxID=9704 RepID=A0A6J2EKP0_ZALCA|nr:tumor necrosis factor receptor superfamily member 17 isoform X2 [Zalophus californianus]